MLMLASAAGCAGRPPHVATPSRVVDVEPLHIEASRGESGYRFRVFDAQSVFERALALHRAGRCDAAVPVYDRVADDFAGSRYVSAALYNAGLCLAGNGELRGAAARFARLVAEVPTSPDVRDARFELLDLDVRLERWPAAVETADALLQDASLSPDLRVEAMARRAEALFGAGDLARAAAEADQTLRYARLRPASDPVRDDEFLASANFVLAETIRARSEQIEVPEGPVAVQRAALERRARLLLEAQDAYFDTMRWTYARWAAAAGYRVGEMYERFWEAMMGAPVPPPPTRKSPSALRLYRHDYHVSLARLIKPLLRHSISYWELTLEMTERTGVQTPWAARIREDLAVARARLADQPPGPDALERAAQASAKGAAKAGARGRGHRANRAP